MLETLLTRKDIPDDMKKVIENEISDRNMIKSELQEYKSKYTTIAENKLIGILIYQNQCIVAVNESYAEMVGYTQKEILALKFKDFTKKIHPDDSSTIIKSAEDFLKGIPHSPKYEYRLFHKDESIIWVESYVTIIEHKGKRALQILYIDITDRKMKESELGNTSSDFKFSIDHAPIGFLSIDRDYTITNWNAYFENLTGLNQKSVLGKNLFKIPGILEGSWDIHFKTAMEKQERVDIDNYRLYVKRGPHKGKVLYSKASFIPLISNEETVGVILYYEDITKYRKLFENVPIALTEYDISNFVHYIDQLKGEGVEDFEKYFDDNPKSLKKALSLMIISDTNKAALRLYCASKYEDLVGKSPEIFITDMNSFKENTLDFIYGKNVFEQKKTDACLDGSAIKVVVNSIVIPTEEGGTPRVLRAAIDITHQEEIINQLEVSEQRYRSIVEDQKEFVVRWSPDGTRTFVNDSFCKYNKTTRDRLIGKSFFGSLSQEDKKRFLSTLKNLSPDNPTTDRLYRQMEKWPDGRITWTSWSERAIFSPKGEVIEYQSVGRDITDIREKEKALELSEEKYRSLISNIPAVTWISTEKGETTFISANVEQIYGFSPQEILKSGSELWFDRIHLEDVERVKKSYDEYFSKKLEFDIEYRIQRKDGKWIWLHDKAVMQFYEENVQLSYGVFMDVTYQKKIEAKLSESESRYRALFESANDGIFLLEKDRILEANKAAIALFQYEEEAFLNNTPYSPLFSPLKQPDGSKSNEKALKFINNALHGEIQFFEWVHKRADGSEFFTEVSLNLLDEEKGLLFGTMRDITERKIAEERLSREKSISETIIDSLPGKFSLYVKYSGNYRLLKWNDEFEKFTGKQPSELLGSNFLDDVHPDDLQIVLDTIKQVETGRTSVIESRNKDFRNEYHYFLSKSAFLELSGKKHIIGVAIDITDRVKLSKMLKESEETLRAIFDNATTGIGLVDLDGFFIRVNPYFRNIMGYSVEFFEKRNISQITHPDYQSEGKRLFNLLCKGQLDYYQRELKLIQNDGNWRWGFLTVSSIRDIENKPQFVLGIAEDIHDRKIAEDALKTSEANFEQLFQESPVFQMEFDFSDVKQVLDRIMKSRKGKNLQTFFDKHPEDTIKIMQKIKILQMNKRSINVLLSKNKDKILQIMEDADYPVMKQSIIAFYDGKTSFKAEINDYTIDGGQVSLLGMSLIATGSEETWDKVYYAAVEMTELVKTESVLRENEEKLRGIIINSQDGIFLTDEEGLISEWNTSMEVITGLKYKTIKDKPFWDTFSSLLPQKEQFKQIETLTKRRIDQAREKGTTEWILEPIEVNVQSHKGEVKFLQISLFIVPKRQTLVLGGICRDQSPEYQAETRKLKEILQYNIEEGSIYLIKESQSLFAKDIFNDLLKIGYKGLVLSRNPETAFEKSFTAEYSHLWLSKQQLPTNTTLLEYIESEINQFPSRSVILFDSLDYLLSFNSFKNVMELITNIRDIAFLFRKVILLSVDEGLIQAGDLKFLEKETKEIESRSISKMSTDLYEILRFIYTQNNVGVRPSYTHIVNELEITRPTARKRVRELLAKSYVRETSLGRTKVFELTQKGINLFISS